MIFTCDNEAAACCYSLGINNSDLKKTVWQRLLELRTLIPYVPGSLRMPLRQNAYTCYVGSLQGL